MRVPLEAFADPSDAALYIDSLDTGTVLEYNYDYAGRYVDILFTKMVEPTAEDIYNMSVSDYGKYRQTMGLDNSYANERVQETANFLVPHGSGSTYDYLRPTSYHSHTYDKHPNETTSLRFKSEPVVLKTYDYEVKENGTIYIPEKNKTYEPSPSGESYIEKYVSYKDMYWAFVNAKDTYEAADNFSKMLDLVTEDMQPASTGSWVEEPEERKLKEVIILKRHSGWVTTFGMALVAITCVLFTLGIL